MSYQSFSERTGRREPRKSLHEGVPDHLAYQVHDWLASALTRGGERIATSIAARLEVPLRSSSYTAADQLYSACRTDEWLCLDVIDMTLRGKLGPSDPLDKFLVLGGSAYIATADGLELRVGDEERAAFSAASALHDEISEELKTAWSHIYGLHPDPSDAWDHAIKAVEALLAPVIVPDNEKATLGSIVHAMEAKPQKWTLSLDSSGSSSDVGAVAALLRLMWPNPDRHQGNNPRKPRQDEAERVVQIAVLIVNACRGYLTSAPTA